MARGGSNLRGRGNIREVDAMLERMSVTFPRPVDTAHMPGKDDAIAVNMRFADRTAEESGLAVSGHEHSVNYGEKDLVVMGLQRREALSEKEQSSGLDWGRSEDSETGSNDVDLGKMPSLTTVNVPIMEKLLSSSDKSHLSSDSTTYTSSSEHESSSSDSAECAQPKQTDANLRDRCDGTLGLAEAQQTVRKLKNSLQNFVFGYPKILQDFLNEILSNQRDFGIYVWDQLRPSLVDGAMRYREGEEFAKVMTIHHSEHTFCGVFLCCDIQTNQQFVLKKIMKHNHRLIGIEFLTQHNQRFLPKIYGIYKDKDIIYIFQEYVKGGTLLNCDWNLAQVRQFAEVLLSAFSYLHSHDLVHCDIKLMNLMVRDPSDPESMVIIDFESAKHPQYPFRKGGHTVTYLPPWHEKITNLTSYKPVLKTVDLWAIACVIIFFLLPYERSELQSRGRGVWNKVMDDIQKKCGICKTNKASVRKYCDQCKKEFMHYVKINGHKILDIHLGHFMDKEIDDPNWKALRQVLEYLTDTNNIHEKHIDIALSIVRGRGPVLNLRRVALQYQ